MLSQQQQQQQQMTVVVDAGTLATDDVTSGREPAAAAAAAAAGACNHRAPPPPPIITRTVATPLATPRGNPVAAATAAAATATGDDVIGDVMTRAASSESFVTSLAGYSDTHIYDATEPVRRCRPRALINYLFAQRRFRFAIRPALSCVAGFVRYTQGEVTSQSLWSRHDRHFVGKTRHNALS